MSASEVVYVSHDRVERSEVEVDDGVLVLKRIHVGYHLRLDPDADREKVERAFDHHMPRCPGSPAGRDIDWLTITDREQSVVDDVRRIRNHPLVPSRIPIYGYVYNVRTGALEEVAEATEVGRPG